MSQSPPPTPLEDRVLVAPLIYEGGGRYYLRIQAWNEHETDRQYIRTWITCAPGISLEDAQQLLQRVKRDLEAGRFLPSRYRTLKPRPTLQDAFEDALSQRIEAGIKPQSVRHWHLYAKKWLPALGRIPVDSIDYYDVREWWGGHITEAASHAAANKALKLLRAVLAHSERTGWRPPGANPASAVSTRMDPPRPRARAITRDDWDQIQAWLAAHDQERCIARNDFRRRSVYMGHWAYAVTQVALAARGAEVCGLVWDDVDWDAHTIIMRDTKTAPSLTRLVSAPLLVMLKQHQKLVQRYSSMEMRRSPHLFPSYLGERTTPNNRFRKIFERALRELHLPYGRANNGWTPHDLRRLGITLLYESGGTTRDVMEFVGHSTAEAHQRYLRATPAHLQILADSVTAAALPRSGLVKPLSSKNQKQ